ncbi:protease inhibitor I42 family protein [Nonomuraea sp. NPDC026600]|uniref:protease inhibitor I42 family protein n=1 Tax=Nonomuraea sp. NPDC026600 TaxID=3155363 RepID=UPI0033C9B0F3
MIRRTAATALLALLMMGIGTSCGAGSAVSDYGQIFKGAKGSTVNVEVGTGQRFSLAVADNPSTGDQWRLLAVPDAKVASFISKEYVSDGGGPGSGGTSYFVFNGKQPGSTEIRLQNCWRCPSATPSPTPVDAQSKAQSGEAIFSVIVK